MPALMSGKATVWAPSSSASHHEELAMHVPAARSNGVSVEEIKELLLQTAVYCGVPDANTAFRIAQQTLGEMGEA